MNFLLPTLQGLLFIAHLVCFVMVIIKMFQSGQQTLGIVCIILAFCAFIGVLIAFIIGWVNATKWDIKNLMWIWTGVWIAGVVLGVIAASSGAAMYPMQR